VTDIEKAKSMLSNIPDDAFNSFFAPLIINDIGWPFLTIHDPLDGTDWFRILFPLSLSSLSKLRWQLSTYFLNKDILHPVSYADLNILISNSIYNIEALFSWYPKKSRERLAWHKKHIETTRRFCTPITVAITSNGIKILDGHHRVAALFSLGLNDSLPVDAWIGSSE